MIKQYATMYFFYTSALLRTIRLVVFASLVIIVFASISEGIVSRIALFLLTWFLMLETFFHFKISRIHPELRVKDTTAETRQKAFSMQLLYADISITSGQGVVEHLFMLSQGQFLLERIGITQNDVKVSAIEKSALYEKAYEVAGFIQAEYITTVSVLGAYLLYTEPQTKLLFNAKVTDEELMAILQWTRLAFSQEEEEQKIRFKFTGEGFADSLISGWTPETQKYTSDFSSDALSRKPYLIGRDEEYQKMCEALMGSSNNNVLLIGNVGSGKESLVSTLANQSYNGLLKGNLNHKKIFELMIGPLIAGMEDRGALETRLQQVIAEVSHAGDVMIYIPEFQNILGSSSYSLDLSGALLPYLQDGKVPIIATVTKGSFKTYVENNPIKQVFEEIELKEPDQKTAIHMLMQKTQQIEAKYKVIITYDSVKIAVQFADRYLTDTSLPGSASMLLEEVANAVFLSQKAPFGKTKKKLIVPDDVLKVVEDKAHVKLSEPKKEEKEILLHLEDKLHERVINQTQAITAISEAMRRVRTGLTSGTKPISFLFLGPTGVGKTETAKALAALTFGGEDRMLRFDMSEYAGEDGLRRLLGSPPGQGDDRGELTEKIREQPSSLVLLDEFEKAHPMIHNLFLQVLEDGRLTDNKGHTVSFLNAMVIATSNAGSEFIRETVTKGGTLDKAFHQSLLDHLQTKGIFKPELLNRFDDVITFRPLGREEVSQITKLLLNSLTNRLREQDITVTFDEKIINKIATEGSDEQFGARPLRRYIQDQIEDKLAQLKLQDKLTRGSNVTLTIDQSGNISIVSRSV